jgi:predicted dehydrogenase
MNMFKLAVIGSGNISRMHFEAYLAHPERVQVVAACDIDRENVDEKCQRYGIAHGFSSLDEMIERAEWDIGIVCTPTSVRREVVEQLAAAGKHIFVEKPFADSYEEALQMVNTSRRAGVSLAVNQNFRYHYPFEAARRLIAQGTIGSVVSVIHQDCMFRQDVGWRIQMSRHAMAVMGVHWFDGFRWMLSDEAVSLICHTSSSPAITCKGETDASALMRFAKGTLVTYVESFSSQAGRTETRVIGEAGTLLLDYDQLSLFDRAHRTLARERWENPLRGPHKPEATFEGLNLLLTALEQQGEPANSGHDNLKTIALLDGAYRSAETGQVISFHEGFPR